jgi:hypothetical protein
MEEPAIGSHSCDVVLEDESLRNSIMIFANEDGRAAIESLFPTAPFDWERRSDIPAEWRIKTISLTEKAELSPRNVIGLGIALLRAGCRVAIKQNDMLKLLESEDDIQKVRPH